MKENIAAARPATTTVTTTKTVRETPASVLWEPPGKAVVEDPRVAGGNTAYCERQRGGHCRAFEGAQKEESVKHDTNNLDGHSAASNEEVVRYRRQIDE